MRSSLIYLLVITLSIFAVGCQRHQQSRQTVDLSGPGWSLWRDQKAPWKEDTVYLPPVDLLKLTVRPPTGGWESLNSPQAIPVSVPGTVEEYLQEIPGPEGALFGVSWWSRTIRIPQASGPRTITLHFEAVRMRAEVFLNRQLVGYDLIGNTPFDVDLTPFVKAGEKAELSIRITNPDGVFDWRDGWLIWWGHNMVGGSHGFGGISGRVKLTSADPIHIEDIWVENTPAITKVTTQVEVKNDTGSEVFRDITLRMREKKIGAKEVFSNTKTKVVLKPGSNFVSFSSDVPSAKIWDLDHPDLYHCEVSLMNQGSTTDSIKQIFGFRWFEPAGIGSDAKFLLNGKRIVLRSAISWGFWPINGLFATPELAEKQMQTAKSLGLNMLNNHRCLGQPILFEKADEMGLLQYEEPGDYSASTKDPFAQACIREKLRRMVIRDRSHPSLIIYNLANEMREMKPEILADQEKDMIVVHTLDPARTLTRTSGWAPVDKIEDQAKMQMRPYDPEIHRQGWYDYHHAPGPDVWLQSFYKDPHSFYNRTENSKEIVFWGEEGAISTPSRLELIRNELQHAPHLGWDGQLYLDWYGEFDRFLDKKKLRLIFPTVDSLTKAIGAISYEHQGRKIEVTRMGNISDGYVINGWESEIIENHSGIVDCFRNPKADASIIAYYNQPLYIPVKPRQQIVKAPGSVVVDFYAINEKNIQGAHTLRLSVADPKGQNIFSKDLPVSLQGGDTYGQLLSEGIEVPVSPGGLNHIAASLLDGKGTTVATGRDDVLGVDWLSDSLSTCGAVWEYGHTLRDFLKQGKGIEVPDYSTNLPNLDWMVVARSPQGGDKMPIPTEYLLAPDGIEHGLKTSFSLGESSDHPIVSRIEPTVNLAIPVGAPPDLGIASTENYTVCWEGNLTPPFSGEYHFDLQASDKATVLIDGKELKFPGGKNPTMPSLKLAGGKSVTLRIVMPHKHHNASCSLLWTMPDLEKIDSKRILDRVEKEGMTLILIENSADWMPLIAKRTGITFEEKFPVGVAWLGGGEFVKDHPIFSGLPVNQGMGWPYQAVVSKGADRYGLKMSGEELVAGAYHCYPNQLGTSVGVIPCGKGRIIFSTLNIFNQIGSGDSSAEVARKLLCNMIHFAGVSQKP